jgi:hypothetical protein
MNSLLFPPKASFTADKNLIEKIGEVAWLSFFFVV